MKKNRPKRRSELDFYAMAGATHLGVSLESLRDGPRRAPLVTLKRLLMKALQTRGFSTYELGDYFKLDHSTVIVGLQTLDIELKRNRHLMGRYERLCTSLETITSVAQCLTEAMKGLQQAVAVMAEAIEHAWQAKSREETNDDGTDKVRREHQGEAGVGQLPARPATHPSGDGSAEGRSVSGHGA